MATEILDKTDLEKSIFFQIVMKKTQTKHGNFSHYIRN